MAVVQFKSQGLSRNDARRLALFTKTVGKELVGHEIDEALEWCEIYGANPFVKDIYFFVFDADKPDKRRVVPVLGIGLYRKIASRSGDYRPDEAPPRFTYDERLKSALNPAGIVSCEVTVYRHSHGAWHPITERLRWDERAPIKEIWAYDEVERKRKPTGQFELDPKKTNWHTMPETMLAKCTEAAAIRKGWPNETSGSYISEEMDAPHTIDLTASEIIAKHDADERHAKIGGAGIMVQWDPNAPLQKVPTGQFGDKVLAFIAANSEEPAAIMEWAARNRHSLQEYWAHDKDGALELRKALERSQSQMAAAE